MARGWVRPGRAGPPRQASRQTLGGRGSPRPGLRRWGQLGPDAPAPTPSPRYAHVYTRALSPEHSGAVRAVLEAAGIATTYVHETAELPHGARGWAELFEGVVAQMAVTGLRAENGFPPQRKRQLVAELRAALAGTGCTVYVSPEAVHVNGPGVGKGAALAHFAARVGVPVEEILRFGDRPAGNDAPMLDVPLVSFNVGERPSPDGSPAEWVGATSRQRSAVAVLSVLDRLAREGRRPRAVAFDFDGTVSERTPDGDARIDPRMAERLVTLLREEPSVPVAIITGRGESILERVVGELARHGATDEELSRLAVYMFNGGAAVRPRRWVRSSP